MPMEEARVTMSAAALRAAAAGTGCSRRAMAREWEEAGAREAVPLHPRRSECRKYRGRMPQARRGKPHPRRR